MHLPLRPWPPASSILVARAARGAGAPGAAAPRRAEGGAREGARDGKGERAASNAWNNSASVWKAAASVPPPPAAAAQLQLRVPPPWPHPHRSRPWSPNLPLPSRLRPARRMTRSWGNSEERWPGGRKPRKVGTAQAAGATGIREPGSGRPPWQCRGAPRTVPVSTPRPRPGRCHRWATGRAQALGGCCPRVQAQPVPCALSARPLSPPSARPRAGICQVSAGKFSRARRRHSPLSAFIGLLCPAPSGLLQQRHWPPLGLSRAPWACVDFDDVYKKLVD